MKYDKDMQFLMGNRSDRERVFIIGNIRGKPKPEILPFRKSNSNIDKEYNKEFSNIRRLTPIECERLQGFPDNWTEGVSDTQRYRQMGNAVTVNVIEAIAKKVIVYMKE